jgi:antitoxin ParD1/3/4
MKLPGQASTYGVTESLSRVDPRLGKLQRLINAAEDRRAESSWPVCVRRTRNLLGFNCLDKESILTEVDTSARRTLMQPAVVAWFRLTRSSVLPRLKSMEVQFTADQKAFVRQALETGRIHREEEAVEQALALWEERERVRTEMLLAVDAAEASLARGEGRTITQESMRSLSSEVKARGRARLADKHPTGQ